MLRLLALFCLLTGGCTGVLVHALEERQVASCVWWSTGPFGTRGVSATGGMPLAECLKVPCPCALR